VDFGGEVASSVEDEQQHVKVGAGGSYSAMAARYQHIIAAIWRAVPSIVDGLLSKPARNDNNDDMTGHPVLACVTTNG
jgi:hypothetical protein